MCFCRIFLHLISKFVSQDVTFYEQESYFVQTHLHGENISKEDVFLLLPNLTFMPKIEAETGGKQC